MYSVIPKKNKFDTLVNLVGFTMEIILRCTALWTSKISVIFMLKCICVRMCSLLQIFYLILNIPPMASNSKENCGALKHSVFYCIETEAGDGADKHVWAKEHSFPTFELGDGIYFPFIAACYTITALILSSGFSIWFQHLFIYVLSN